MIRTCSLGWAQAGLLALSLLAGTSGARAQIVLDQDRIRQNNDLFQQKQYDVDKMLRDSLERDQKVYGRRPEEPAPKLKVNVEEAGTWAVILGLAAVAGFLGLKAVGNYLHQSSVAAKVAAREQALKDPWVQGRLAQTKATGSEAAGTPPVS